jgi:hypothetical protein
MAEGEISQVKKWWKIHMKSKHIPKCLWDYGLVHEAEVLSILA